MPKLAAPSFNGVSIPPDLRRVLEAAMRPAAAALNNALVLGDSVQTWGPVQVAGTGAGLAPSGFVGFAAHLTTNQTIANNTDATVLFDAVDLDTNAAYSAATGIYTVPVTGKYLISTTIQIDHQDLTGTAEAFLISYIKHNTTQIRTGFIDVVNKHVTTLAGSVIRSCAVGDTILAQAHQSVPSSLISRSVDGATAPILTHMSIARLG